MSRYLLAAFFGGLIGAGCVLVMVYVTNTKALVVTTSDVNEAVGALHSRINDFYIFAGIVITLLLAINVGVFIRAEDEVEKHIDENFGRYKKKIKNVYNKCEQILNDLEGDINNKG